MDKKNLTIGVLLMIAAFASMYFFKGPPPAPAPAAPKPVAGAPGDAALAAASPAATPGALPPAAPATPAATAASAAAADSGTLVPDAADATITTISNAYAEYRLTDMGAAISSVSLLKYPATLHSDQPYVFNEPHIAPMLAMAGAAGLDQHTRYQLVSHTTREAVYRTVLNGQIEVTRRYALPDASGPGSDPYQVRLTTTFRNLTDQPLALPRLNLSLGTSEAANHSIFGREVTTVSSNGKSQDFIGASKLNGGGLLSHIGMGSSEPTPSISSPGPVVWAAVGNQFFTSLLTPDHPAIGLTSIRVPLPPSPKNPKEAETAIAGTAQFQLDPLPARGEVTQGLNFYVGPKEYRRLANTKVFQANQDKVMHFGFFSLFSEVLLTIMTWVHGWMQSVSPAWAWGWAVVITTLILKVVFLPLTLISSRSSKRMQKIQPEMKALREKFKDNPKKMQQATMELFKRHKVNPMGGCLPMLVTIPFFWGFFEMLRYAAELRFQPFLWAADLTSPDTVAHVFGYPLNILPLLMGATMFFQMKLMPQPTMDNAQSKIFKLMPIGLSLLFYNYSCALALYYSISNGFTIVQQVIINRMKDDLPEPAAATATAGGAARKPVKNVTPNRRK